MEEGTIEFPPMNFRWMLSVKFFSLNLSKKRKKQRISISMKNQLFYFSSSLIFIVVHYRFKEKKTNLFYHPTITDSSKKVNNEIQIGFFHLFPLKEFLQEIYKIYQRNPFINNKYRSKKRTIFQSLRSPIYILASSFLLFFPLLSLAHFLYRDIFGRKKRLSTQKKIERNFFPRITNNQPAFFARGWSRKFVRNNTSVSSRLTSL